MMTIMQVKIPAAVQHICLTMSARKKSKARKKRTNKQLALSRCEVAYLRPNGLHVILFIHSKGGTYRSKIIQNENSKVMFQRQQ